VNPIIRCAHTQTHLPDLRFPEGIKGTANKVHDLGFKFGIYSSAGTMTCGRYPGSIGYEAIDAETFAAWGVDYLKVGSPPSLQN
jgi:alpha-galactosidase